MNGNRRGLRLLLVLALASTPFPALCQAGDTLRATAGPSVRKIETAQAVSLEMFGSINAVRQFANGNLLVNDGVRRRVLLLDSTLRLVRVVLDSVPGTANSYGARAGALVASFQDSAMFLDAGTLSMLMIGSSGEIARVRAVPRPADAAFLLNASGQFGIPAVDARGRLVYRIIAEEAAPPVRPPRDVPYAPNPPDSAFVVAFDLETRRLDTLGTVRTRKSVIVVSQSVEGTFDFNSTVTPLPLVDEWSVLSDGTVAFVRGRDYHVDFVGADGKLTSSEKMPFPWLRISDEDKTRMMDSVYALDLESERHDFVTNMIVWANLTSKPYPSSLNVPADYALPPGLPRNWRLPLAMVFPNDYVAACVVGSSPSSGCTADAFGDRYRGSYRPPPPTVSVPVVFPAADLPDYRPPFAVTAVRADQDRNVWIRTMPMKPTAGGPIFDVVSRDGRLTDRIQIPAGYSLAGFGAGRVVYLAARSAAGVRLSRVHMQ